MKPIERSPTGKEDLKKRPSWRLEENFGNRALERTFQTIFGLVTGELANKGRMTQT